ncbi:Ger(x)C family spore germination protein [Salinithrix halophila]|uniref:Ger(X)C family spore germination protein n=1 Tax=Salinithrix halophila TaxID=1485204 RepID=A0ABV8JNQ8_9BACL
MIKRIGILCLVGSLLLLTATGCWDRRELNTLGIAIGIGIDKVGTRYRVTAQIVSPEAVTGQRAQIGPLATTYQAMGDTVFEALRKITTKSPRKIYVAHIRVLILSETLAKEGIRNVLDFFFRDPEVRPDFYVLIAKKNSARDLLSQFTRVEKIPASKMFFSLETSEKSWAPTKGVKLDQLLSEMMTKGKAPVLAGVEIRGEEETGETEANLNTITPPSLVVIELMGVLNKDRLVGWLNQEESKGYNYIRNNITNTVGHLPCPQGGKVVIEVKGIQSKIKGEIRKGKPKLTVEIKGEGNVGEVACNIDLSKKQTLYELEKRTEQRIKKMAEMSIKKAQGYRSDIFGFGEAIYRSDPNVWKKLKKNWDREFVKLKPDVKVDFKIRQTGSAGNSFIEGM